MSMFDLKVINSVLGQLEEERGIPKKAVIEAIEAALATAYKKEYGKRGQIVRAHFSPETGDVDFEQIKIVVDESLVRMPEDDETEEEASTTELKEGEEVKIRFNPEQHILIDDARRIKKDVELEEELSFPLQVRDEYGRISAQTAKQVIIQKIREAERSAVTEEFGDREGEIVSGTVQRQERGIIFVELDRATGILPYEEQIPGERFRQGERIRAYLKSVDDSGRGVYLKLSRSAPEFLKALFSMEAPEVQNGTVEIKAIAREAGSRSKVAVISNDEYIDPVGSLVGQRGVRVSTVTSELGGEKIDIIEYSELPERFIEEALSPAQVLSVTIDPNEKIAHVVVAPDQQSLAIGKGGQNARLAAKLTGYKIDISSAGEETADAPVSEAPVEADTHTQDELTDMSPEEELSLEGIEESPVEDNTDETGTEEADDESSEEALEEVEERADIDGDPTEEATDEN